MRGPPLIKTTKRIGSAGLCFDSGKLKRSLDMGGDGAFVSIMCYAWPRYLNRPKVRKKNPNALSQLTDAH